MNGWMEQGAETHKLRWFVYEGRGAADSRAHTSFTEVMLSFPSLYRPLPALCGKVGTR